MLMNHQYNHRTNRWLGISPGPSMLMIFLTWQIITPDRPMSHVINDLPLHTLINILLGVYPNICWLDGYLQLPTNTLCSFTALCFFCTPFLNERTYGCFWTVPNNFNDFAVPISRNFHSNFSTTSQYNIPHHCHIIDKIWHQSMSNEYRFYRSSRFEFTPISPISIYI
jgi:hypothetical protein